jgi:NAD(P)H-dependent flavin oxidoreductase YrpB (nitropropane dioxygenase family)
METAFTKLLLLQAPIMQAPMGGAVGPELAAAVSNAGALGSIPIWTVQPEEASAIISATSVLTDRPYAVNVRADLGQASHVRVALDAGVMLVHLFWGDPTPYVGMIREAGARLLVTVADADEAKQALDAGADILVAQGWEAGGHVRGNLTTMALVPTVVDLAGSVPVLAAGGIVDGRGLVAAMALGAAGVVMGTRFIASVESCAHPEYKEAIVAARQVDTVHTESLFDRGWANAPHRVLRNSTYARWQAAGSPRKGSRPGEGDVVARRADGSPIPRYGVATPRNDFIGDIEAMARYAGQGVGAVRQILPAAEIIGETMKEAHDCLSRLSR